MPEASTPSVPPRADGASERPLTTVVFARGTAGFYFAGQIAGLARELATRGGRLVVVQTVDPNDERDRVVRIPAFDVPLAWDEADGAVMVSLSARAEVLERFRQEGKPVVLTHPLEGFEAPLAQPDNRGATVTLVEHLLEHGHRSLAFVGPRWQQDMDVRADTFVEVVRERGLGEGRVVQPADSTTEDAEAVVDELLALDPRPTAVVSATDTMAFGLLRGLAARGVRVPEDMAVVSHDDVVEGTFSRPSLSSVRLRFDDVGALAGRMLVDALDGRPWAVGTYEPTAAGVSARASCGCTPGLLDAVNGGREVPAPRTSRRTPDVVREVADTLRHGLAGTPGVEDVVGPVVTALERVLDGRADAGDARAVLSGLRRLTGLPDLLHPTVDLLWHTLLRTGAVSGAGGPVSHALATELWHLQADALQREVVEHDELLGEQYRIASSMLKAVDEDAGDLDWLEGTHVRAGVLAVWDGDPAEGRLRIRGAYDPHGVLGDVVGGSVPARSFPPRPMIDLARPEEREACFVVPVRTADRDWGLLAVVGDIDPTSRHSHYHYWAALLASAFEEQSLKASLRRSEERYAYAAQAANDGLWEVDLATGEFYASVRLRELLGVDLEAPLRAQDGLDRIRREDAARVDAALRQVQHAPGQPVNVEFRTVEAPESRWLLARALGVPGRDGTVRKIVGSLSDIHPRKELEQRLRHGALYDDVTGLPNRRHFLERLGVAIHRTMRRSDAGYAVIFLDLDGFKLVNDSLGHLVGDQLLTVVADRLRSTLRAEDTAARFGGDEFAVLLLDPHPDEVLAIAARIQEAVAAPVTLSGQEVSVSASAGIATSQSGYRDVSDVLRDADTAMYAAKETEPGTATVYDPQMHTRARARLQQRAELRAALAEEQFVVHYQPVVAFDGSPLTQFEALVRWQHPERGLLGPGEFLDAMEDMSLVVPLGRWILSEVCRQIVAWEQEGLVASVAVNLSHQEFWAPDLVPALRSTLVEHGLSPERLHLEITETVVMDDADAAHAVMARLRGLGVSLSIDDFGTGTSSLHALRSLPADMLKIDGSFVRDMDEAQTAALVRVIVEIGEVLGLKTIAECVETDAQAQMLRSMGCAYGQGWLWSKAVPADEAAELMRTARELV